MNSIHDLMEVNQQQLNLSEVVGRSATHVVVNGRQDRNWFTSHIDAGEDHRRFRDARKTSVQLFRRQVRHSQIDVVVILTTASAADMTEIQDKAHL